MREAEKVLCRYGCLTRLTAEQEEEVKAIIADKGGVIDGVLRIPQVGISGKSYRRSDSVYDMVEKLVDVYDARISAAATRLSELDAQRLAVRRVLDAAGFTKLEWEYVNLHFVEEEKLADVAEAMGYSRSQVLRIGRKVTDKVERALG